jgi:hypothetical protein
VGSPGRCAPITSEIVLHEELSGLTPAVVISNQPLINDANRRPG